jgi:hypothetical protein
VGPQEGERARGEPRLNDGPLVGEVQRDGVAREVGDGGVDDRGDRGGERGFLPHALDRPDGLRGRAASADHDRAIDRAIDGQLGGCEGVGDPESHVQLGPAGGIGLRDEPAGAAPQGHDPLAGVGKHQHRVGGERLGAPPAVGL